MIAGDPAVLAELCARRGPAVLAFVEEVCDPAFHVRAAADAFARFRAEVAHGPLDVHPDTLLMRATRRAALELSPPGPDLGCAPARPLLAARAERAIEPADASGLTNHLRICEFCRGLAMRVAAGETAYRDAEERPVPADAAAAIVAAMAAAAPLRAPAAEPRFNGHPPARPPEVEPRVEKPEPRIEQVAVPDAPPRPVKPYYELPAPPTRRRRREWEVSARVGAVAGAAAALSRRARDAAERVLDRPSQAAPEPVAEPQPPPVDKAAFVEPPPPEPVPDVAAISEPEPEPDPDPAPIVVIDEQVADARFRPASRPVRERSEPPRLARPRRERRHRPLLEHSPRELVMPTALVVAAVAVILAIAGVFGGESTHVPTISQVRVSQPSPARLAAVPPAASATSVSLEQAAAATGTATATQPAVTVSP